MRPNVEEKMGEGKDTPRILGDFDMDHSQIRNK